MDSPDRKEAERRFDEALADVTEAMQLSETQRWFVARLADAFEQRVRAGVYRSALQDLRP